MAALGRTKNKTRCKAKAMSEMRQMVFSRGILEILVTLCIFAMGGI